MFLPQRRPGFAAALVLVLAAGGAAWLRQVTEPLRHPAGSEYDELLLAVASWVLLGCAAWAVVIGVAAVLETSSSGQLPVTAWVGCPQSLRRLLVTGLGVAIVGAGPVQAPATASAHTPLPAPARPVGSVQADRQTTLLVHPGDNLWRIAAKRLRPSASAADVAEHVTALHHRNRAVIGPDPDLIRPGQHLVPPRMHHSRLSSTHDRRQEETR